MHRPMTAATGRRQFSRSHCRAGLIKYAAPATVMTGRWSGREPVPTRRSPGKEFPVTMLSRATTNAVAHRQSSMRRMRRRTVNASRLYCATNGCTSFLVIDELGGVAYCEICGYTRKVN